MGAAAGSNSITMLPSEVKMPTCGLGTVRVVVLTTTPASVLTVRVKLPANLTEQLRTSVSVVLLEAKLGLVQAPLVSTTMLERKSLPPKKMVADLPY